MDSAGPRRVRGWARHPWQVGPAEAGRAASKGSSSEDARRAGRLLLRVPPSGPALGRAGFYDNLLEWLRRRRRQLRLPFGKEWHLWQETIVGTGGAGSKGSSGVDARWPGYLFPLAPPAWYMVGANNHGTQSASMHEYGCGP